MFDTRHIPRVLVGAVAVACATALAAGFPVTPSGSLLAWPAAAASPAAATKDPRPPTARVSKGTYFSTRYKTRLNVRRSGWNVKRIVVRGNGIHRVIRGTRRSLMLAPGTYRVTVHYVEKPDPLPKKWRSLGNLDVKGATFALTGGEQTTSTTRVMRWQWDPTADPNKGYAYLNEYLSEAGFLEWATKVGAVLEGRLACLRTSSWDPTKLEYYRDNFGLSYVLVARDDPRIYGLPEPSHWYDYNANYVPEEPGKVQWHYSTGGLYYERCLSGFAFRRDQVPADYDWTSTWNQTPWMARLPDGNWRLHVEEVPSGKKWVGTVTALLPSGVTYESPVESLERRTGQSPDEDYGYWRPNDPAFLYAFDADVELELKRETVPTQLLESKTVAGPIKVRAVNAPWVSRGEAKAIKVGMSKDQVFRIIGSKGSLEVRSAGLEVRQWDGITIGFWNGQVASIVY